MLTGLHCRGRSALWDTLLRTHREIASERELATPPMTSCVLSGSINGPTSSRTLPYGEQRLLGVAMALAVKLSMLLLDEPVSGMNPSETARFVKLVEKIRASGVTILLVEHDMPMVMEVCDRIVVLNYGRIIAEARHEIQSNPEVIRAYLGRGKKRA